MAAISLSSQLPQCHRLLISRSMVDLRNTRKRCVSRMVDGDHFGESVEDNDGSRQSTKNCEDYDDATQRSGKWSADEESFANKLVYDFETGCLEDCEEGTTLRSYLARKLNCAPMRISKKFAGRCIGKVRIHHD